jgi:hypothetical protein
MALRIKKNKPKVIRIKGNPKKVKIGSKNAFKIPKIVGDLSKEVRFRLEDDSSIAFQES